MVDGEGLIKPVQRWDKSIGKYIKPVFLEIGAHGHGLKKEFNDDNEVQLFLHEMPKDIVNGSPEEFNNYVSVEEGTLTVKYEPEEGRGRTSQAPVPAAATAGETARLQ